MKRLWPIRAYLFLLVLAFAVPLLGLMCYWEFNGARNRAELERGQALHIAEAVAVRTEQFLNEVERVLGKLAQKPGVRAMDPSRPDPVITTFLDQVDLYPHFANIEVIDLTGRVIQSAVPQQPKAFASVADTRWFQTARRTGQFVVGEPFIGPITHKWISMLAYPIRDDAGRLAGLLALPIDLVQFREEVAGAGAPESVVTTIVNADGVLIARSSDDAGRWVGRSMKGQAIVDDVLARRAGQARTSGIDGVDRVYGFTTIPKAGWHVFTGIPAEAVFASVRVVILRSMLLVAVVICMVLLLGRQLSRSIARPVQLLAEAASAVAQGHLSARAIVAGPAEIAAVATQFNEMLDVRREEEAALRMSEDRLAGVISSAMDAIIAVDEQLKVVMFNVAAETMFMFPAAEAPGQPIERFIPDRLGAMTGLRSNGEEFPIEASVSGVESGGETLSTIIIRDVSERRKQELELARINRLYAALSEVDQTIVRVQTRQELFERVCRALVQQGGFRMACIGWHDPNRDMLVPVAQCGGEGGFLDAIRIYTDDGPESHGPTETSFREGRTYICNDFINEPASLPWRTEAERNGFRSSAALPIRFQGDVRGTLTVYATDAGVFQSREVTLLEEAASDISFALDNLAHDEQRRAAEKSLGESEDRFRTMANSIPQLAWIAHPDGNTFWYNERWFEYTGTTLDDMVSMGWRSVHDPDLLPAVMARWSESVSTGQPFEMEFPLRGADGRFRTFLTRVMPLRSPDGRVLQWFGTNTDVDELKRVELALRESEARFHAFMDAFPDAALIRDESGRHLFVNKTSVEIFGLRREAWIGKTMFELGLLPHELAESVCQLDRQALELGHPVEEFNDSGDVCGPRRYWRSVRFPFQSATGERLVGALAFDITARVQAEEALRAAQARLEAVVDNMTEGLLIFNLQGDLLERNAAMLRMQGFSEGEEAGTSVNDFLMLYALSTPDGRSLSVDELPIKRVMRGEVLRDYVVRLRRRDSDSSRIVSISGSIAHYGNDQALAFLTINDVTERTEAEKALRMATERLQMLSRRLLEIQETERRQLAIELHDEIGQALTAAKINLQSLQRFPEPANLARRLEDSVQIVDRAFNQVRSLSLELRPSLLDDLGLAPAVRWLAAQHADRAGVALHFVSELGDTRFDPAVEIASFRIIQEAVNNVVKHAGATEMTVDLRATGDALHVRVRDDGAGFDVAAARQRAARADSLGMLGMEERASLGSGNIEWLSAPGLHTEVHAWFPLSPKSRMSAR